jgi:hypothetical protein
LASDFRVWVRDYVVYNLVTKLSLRGSESTPRQVYSLQECYNSFYWSSVCPTLLPVVALPPRGCGNGQSLLILRLRGPWRFLCVIKWSLNQLVWKFSFFFVLQHKTVMESYYLRKTTNNGPVSWASVSHRCYNSVANARKHVYVVTTTGEKMPRKNILRVKFTGIFWARFLRSKRHQELCFFWYRFKAEGPPQTFLILPFYYFLITLSKLLLVLLFFPVLQFLSLTRRFNAPTFRKSSKMFCCLIIFSCEDYATAPQTTSMLLFNFSHSYHV